MKKVLFLTILAGAFAKYIPDVNSSTVYLQEKEPVTMQGYIIKQAGNQYWFKDLNNNISIIVIEEDVWKHRDVRSDDLIEIQGDRNLKRIKVKDFKIIESKI